MIFYSMERRTLQWTFYIVILVVTLNENSLSSGENPKEKSKLGTCESFEDGTEICNVDDENKYSKDSNSNKKGSSSSSEFLESKLQDLKFNNADDSSQSIGNENIIFEESSPDKWETLQIPVLDAVKIGHVQEIEVMKDVMVKLKTLSTSPPIFEIKDFLDPLECDFIMAMADRKGMVPKIQRTHNDGIAFEGPENTFRAWDYNRNGFIDAEEIVLLPGKIDLQFYEKDALKMFSDLEMDKNNDGKIDLKEFKNTELVKIKEYIKERLQDNSQRRNASNGQAWLWHDHDELLRYEPDVMEDFHGRLEAVTKIPKKIIKESEPLQVLKYEKGSYHYCQQESEASVESKPCCQYGDTKKCRMCRFMTILYFLNDVEEGGQVVFPLANSEHEVDIMNNSGNWTGFFTYAKTTGSRNSFDVQLTFKTDGANKVMVGNGTDGSGKFEIVDSLVADNIVWFRKRYLTGNPNEAPALKYAGRIRGNTIIDGKWWLPGHQRMQGRFFMYYKPYHRWADHQMMKCDNSAFCPKGSLVIKPKKGTALMWYNHKFTDKGWVGTLDPKMYLGNCDVTKGEKWIAKSWINIMGDGNTTLRAWKSGKNWLLPSSRAKHQDIREGMKRQHREEENDIIEETIEKDMKEQIQQESEQKPPERHVLSAVTSLLNVLDDKGIVAVSRRIHEKLQMTCIPLMINHEGRIRVVDGSKE